MLVGEAPRSDILRNGELCVIKVASRSQLSSAGLRLAPGSCLLKSESLPVDLYETHRAGLLAYARRLSGDGVLAEDIVHDAWLLFSRQPAGSVVSPVSYLRTIIRNLLLGRLRRAGIERISTADFDVAVSTIVDNTVSPEDTVATREIVVRIMEAIDAMPDRQARAIRMYHFEGMKLREVAAALGISIPLVHGLIAEGMAVCNRIRREGQ